MEIRYPIENPHSRSVKEIKKILQVDVNQGPYATKIA